MHLHNRMHNRMHNRICNHRPIPLSIYRPSTKKKNRAIRISSGGIVQKLHVMTVWFWVPSAKTKLLWLGTALHLLNILLKSTRQSSLFQMNASFQESLFRTFSEPLFLSQENSRNWKFRLPLHWLPSCTYFQPRMTLWECLWVLVSMLTAVNSTCMISFIIKLMYITSYFSSDSGRMVIVSKT